MKEIKVHPIVFALAIAVTLALVLLFGYRTALAPPPSVVGIGRDGKPMTREQGEALGRAMSGGRYQGSSGTETK
jgi:hypothetical protein